jgi:hypothetical protein
LGSSCGSWRQPFPPQGVWHQPGSEEELREVLAGLGPAATYRYGGWPGSRLRIVGGNTGTGVFKHDEESYDAFVDINKVQELKVQSNEPMYLGANVTITDAIHFFGAAGELEEVVGLTPSSRGE